MHRPRILIAIILTLAACAPTTQLPTVSTSEIEAEKQRQRQIAFGQALSDSQRLVTVAARLMRGGAGLCGLNTVRWSGTVAARANDFPEEWRGAARERGFTDDKPKVLATTESGIQVGDEITEVEGVPVAEKSGERDPYDLSNLDRAESYTLTVSGATTHQVSVSPERVCAYKVRLDQSTALNAFADGNQIVVTKGMMRFVRDDNELAFVVAHELAHNIMHHIDVKTGNIAAGVLIGGIFDVLAAVGGVNTSGAFMKAGADIGAQAYSQQFEAEADYIGTYLLARSGYPIDELPNFWRRMAAQDPKKIEFARTHPTTAERAVRINATIREIRGKIERRVALIPNVKGEEKLEIDRQREIAVLHTAEAALDYNPPAQAAAASVSSPGAGTHAAAPSTETSTAQRTALLESGATSNVTPSRPADAISTVDLAEAFDLKRTASTKAKLREFPSPDATVLAEIEKGSGLVITDLEPRGWAQVRSDEGALGWVESSALQGGAGDIQYAIGQGYLKRLKSDRDYAAAKRWLELAADGGDENAHATLADLYYEGLNEPRNYGQALAHYKRAAEGGVVAAQEKLALMYEKGLGAQKNFSAASRWYRVAAQSGDAAAQYRLGLLYYKGQGVKRDLVQAYIWLSLAEDADYPAAARQRDNVAIEMPTEQREMAEEAKKLAEKTIRREGGG